MKEKSVINSLLCKKIPFLFCLALMLLWGCNNNPNQKSQYADEIIDLEMSTDMKDAYQESSDLMDEISIAMRSFDLTKSEEDFHKLFELYGDLQFNYEDDNDMSPEAKKVCNEHKFKVDSVRFVVNKLLEENVSTIRQTLLNEDDKLMDKNTSYPFYLPKGTVLYIDYEASSAVNTKIYNADSEASIRTWNGKKEVHDSIVINNGAIYVWEIMPKAALYVTATVKRNCKSLDDYDKEYDIDSEDVECKAGAAHSRKIDAIKINSVFEEPRKVTLRSQGKAFFSGGSRSVVTMQVPANCTDILYSLRISTSQSDISDDGQFCNTVNEKYKKIKFLGLPLYESHGTTSNIFRELLNASEPYREEEAYCNLYVFTKQDQAKKFMDGSAVSELKYNVDLSKQGTQSCNDRIPAKGLKTIYFGFENTRVRYSVYLWLESLATIKTTETVKTKYVLK